MLTNHRERLAGIRRFDQLVAYLRNELGWPIVSDDFEALPEDLTFDYTAEELGIDPKNAAKIQEIKRLRPLVVGQPWGVFFVKFAPKRLPVVALRRILRQVAKKGRPSANTPERQMWAADDLLFVSNYGEGDARQIAFAHFSEPQSRRDLPTLKVLGWDNLDTGLRLDAVASDLRDHLVWPEDDGDAEAWRDQWRAAFTLRHHEVITTSKQLSARLAELAKAIRDRAMTVLSIENESGRLTQLMEAFRGALVHDLDEDGFADMYAQTIAYGLLSARITDPEQATADDFAAHMRTNPFLRDLLASFLKAGGRRGAGGLDLDFDELGVSEVVELLNDAIMEDVVRDFGDRNPQEDPVIHFYEHFLADYDKKKKVERGVFYTPRPVVSFIVRSVDELLRTEFGLSDGLADTTTWGAMAERHEDLKIPSGTSPNQAFVQILDPATGTGTFLVETIDLIHKTMADKWKAQGHGPKAIENFWNEYVPEHLLPRLYGYELLMAPYAISHLKIGLKLRETGYRFDKAVRAQVYLTNALEPPANAQIPIGFLPALAHEAAAVSEVKRLRQFTAIIGNPPYAQYSSNLQDFAKDHIDRFRYTGGIRIRARNALQLERNLNDDYVKFLGFATSALQSAPGVLGFITNRMFLESESLVGLREWISTHFRRAFFLDLRGSSEESRRVPRLAHDQNVFEIQQGVAVSLLVSRACIESAGGADAEPATFSSELVGPVSHKYQALANSLGVRDSGWTKLAPKAPTWRLDGEVATASETSAKSRVRTFSLDRVFREFSTLVASNRDHLVVALDRTDVIANATNAQAFRGTDKELCDRFSITAKKGWNIAAARRKLAEIESIAENVQEIEYRPFDRRFIFFHPSLVWQTAPVCSRNVLDRTNNRLLVSLGKNRAETTNGQWISSGLADKSVVTTRDNASGFPLYLYDDKGSRAIFDLTDAKDEARPNFRREFIEGICSALGLPPHGPFGLPTGILPEDILHFIYALLQAPSYRTYWHRELVTGFPLVPLPPSHGLFRDLAQRGASLAALHLLESPKLAETTTDYAGPRTPEVSRVGWSAGTVWLDARKTVARERHRATQPGTIGFHGVPEEVWDFRVGGYQVCHKWLNDRKGRTLSDEDITHYQKFVVALNETIRIVAEIDEVIEAHGGWPAAFEARAAAGTGAQEAAKVLPFRPRTIEPAPEDRYVTCVPLVPLKAAAGGFSGQELVEEDAEFEWVEVQSRHRLRPGMFVAQVVGRSMEPTVPDGSWCLFRGPVEGTREGRNVLVQLRDATDPETGQHYTVKRYRSEKAKRVESWRHERITLEPANPEFESIVFSGAEEDELQIIAELVEVLAN